VITSNHLTGFTSNETKLKVVIRSSKLLVIKTTHVYILSTRMKWGVQLPLQLPPP